MGIADDLQGLATRLVEPLRGYFVAWDSRSSGARIYYAAGAQSITNATTTTVSFDTARYDYGGYYNAANPTRLTVPVAGTYLVSANVRFASSATGERRVFIQLNGTAPIGYQLVAPVSGNVTVVNVTTVYNFTAGGYVEVLVYQNSGAALNVDSVSAYTPEFMIARI